MNYLEYAEAFEANEEVKGWVGRNLVNYLSKNPENQDEIEHIIDYLVSDEAPKRLKSMSYDEAKKNAEKWTKAQQKKGQHIVEKPEDTEVVLDFEDGFKIVKLVGKNAYEREGYLMRHCVASYYGNNSVIYSLRDKQNNPHATLEDGEQVKGKGNGDIHPKYVKYVVKFLEFIGMIVGDNEMKHLGYVNMSKFKKDLSKDTKYFNEVYLPASEKLIDKDGKEYVSFDLLSIKPLIVNEGNSIKINFELPTFIKLSFERIKNKSSIVGKSKSTSGNYAHSATSGYRAHSATSGNYAHSATSGNYAPSATSGDRAHSATSGYGASSATSGDDAPSATSGDDAPSATSGNYAHSATSGNYAHSATSGNYAHSATSGNYAHSATSGDRAHSATSGNYAHSATSGDRAHSATSGNYAHSATSGNYAPSATSGDRAPSATSGNYAHSATSGNYAHSATSGDDAPSATSGNYAHSATSGNYAHSATSGDDAPSATSGNYAHSATSGDRAPSATSGYGASSATSGDNISCSVGRKASAKAAKGGWIVLAEWSESSDLSEVKPVGVKAIQVDGKKIKADTFYELKDGKFVEL